MFVRKTSINLKTPNFKTQGREWGHPGHGEKKQYQM